jgi:hypothetical protein
MNSDIDSVIIEASQSNSDQKKPEGLGYLPNTIQEPEHQVKIQIEDTKKTVAINLDDNEGLVNLQKR